MIERLRSRFRSASPRARLGLAAGMVVAIALAVSSLGGGGSGFDRLPPALGAADEQPDPGEVVRTPDGKPLKGPDGKPVRVGKDGKTLVDSQGRALRTASGKKLRLRADGSVPPAALRLGRERDGRAKLRVRGEGRVRRRRALSGDPVVLGVYYMDDDSCEETRDYDVGACPNGRAIGEAVAAHVNATGGIAGRRLELEYRTRVPDSRAYEAQFTEACAEFAAGRKPLAVMYLGMGYTMAPCLAAHGIGYINNAPFGFSRGVMADYPNHLFVPSGAAYDRWQDEYVSTLKQAGFFAPGTRVGFGYARDTRTDSDGERAMREALRANGIKPVAEVGIELPRSDNDVGPVLRDIANAVVRFRAAGVNRIVLNDRAVGLGLFMTFAEAQGYRPKYGISTASAPTGVLANAPEAQLENVVGGIGWAPLVDVTQAEDPTEGAAERQQCYRILRSAGISLGARNVVGAMAAIAECDSILLVRSALDTSKSATLAGLRSGLESTSRGSGLNFATRIDSSRHDGAAGFRFLRYLKSCRCMRYLGGTRPLD